MDGWTRGFLLIVATLVLILLNGFFVAAEFAMVKVRGSKLGEMARQERPFAKTAQWMAQRLDRALSACQLGITMASLGLGWIGEPAVARLLEPVFRAVGVSSPALIHSLAFTISFAAITAGHLVLGEQVPKIYAIRRPGQTARWCSVPLRWFYVATYPLLMGLNASTAFILRRVGLEGILDHDTPHSEQEIRALLSQAHAHGELTRAEHTLLDAVFEFDDTISRQIMVPRVEVEYFDVKKPFSEAMARARRSKHTRYPLCVGSLDNVLGVVHIKDLLHAVTGEATDLKAICRPPRYVPETMPLSRLLGLFQASRQHMALVIDEYGTVAGVVTLENVLEQIVGTVQDEFDEETAAVVPEEPGSFLVQGRARIEEVNRVMKTEFTGASVETMAGLLTERLGRIVSPGDRIDLGEAYVEVLEVKHSCAARLRVVLSDSPLRKAHQNNQDGSTA